MRRVAIYGRVSTLNDVQDGSYEMQIEYYKRKVELNKDMALVDVYGDHGRSGRQIKGRPEFQRMIKDCEAGKIDLILTKSISRFARNMLECVNTIRHLIELNVEVEFEKESISTLQMQSELFLSIFAAIAQAESVSLGENKKLADKRRHALGKPTYHASYGYKKEENGFGWNVVESEAKRVRLAYYLACNWYRYPDIRKELQKIEDAEGTGKEWNQTPVVYMLNNVSYIGDVLTNKTFRGDSETGLRCFKNNGEVEQYYIKDHHEPIVSRELFAVVQKITESGVLMGYRKNFSAEDKRLMERAKKLAESMGKEFENYGNAKNSN